MSFERGIKLQLEKVKPLLDRQEESKADSPGDSYESFADLPTPRTARVDDTETSEAVLELKNLYNESRTRVRAAAYVSMFGCLTPRVLLRRFGI